jgi:hypothetical protein
MLRRSCVDQVLESVIVIFSSGQSQSARVSREMRPIGTGERRATTDADLFRQTLMTCKQQDGPLEFTSLLSSRAA